MAKVSAGKFEIEVQDGVWPIMATIRVAGHEVLAYRIDARELPDLDYAVTRARIEARAIANRLAPKEVQKL